MTLLSAPLVAPIIAASVHRPSLADDRSHRPRLASHHRPPPQPRRSPLLNLDDRLGEVPRPLRSPHLPRREPCPHNDDPPHPGLGSLRRDRTRHRDLRLLLDHPVLRRRNVPHLRLRSRSSPQSSCPRSSSASGSPAPSSSSPPGFSAGRRFAHCRPSRPANRPDQR